MRFKGRVLEPYERSINESYKDEVKRPLEDYQSLQEELRSRGLDFKGII